ncbi:MAG: hypothetical protein JWP81_1539 [Ferruginibacter sp.]|nr:hypothetical protein [Ferruginibacter sp.]
MELNNVKMAEFLKDRKVIIVCPSKTIESSGLGDFIDSHDMIVRLNNGYNLTLNQQRDFGSRTDIIYHYLGLQSENQTDYDLRKISAAGTKILVIPPRPEKIHFEIFLERNVNAGLTFLRIGEAVKKELWDEIGCLAFCGIWAVFHLLKFPVKSVQVVGMNFFSTGHYVGYDNRTEEQQIAYALNSQYDKRGIEKQHHIPPQKQLLKRMYETDRRLRLDAVTKNAISVK